MFLTETTGAHKKPDFRNSEFFEFLVRIVYTMVFGHQTIHDNLPGSHAPDLMWRYGHISPEEEEKKSIYAH